MIYFEAKVARGQFIDFNFRVWARKRRLQDHDEDFDAVIDTSDGWMRDEQPFPEALLRVSRLVHSEVEAMFYSTNTFATSLPSPAGLWPLEMLSDTAINNLTTLVVSLRPCRCITPDGCPRIDWDDGVNVLWPRQMSKFFWDDLSDNPHGRPLGRISRTDKNTVAQWQRICRRLSGFRPGQLRLYVVAEVADLETAHAVLDPLRSIPVLDIAISLRHRKEAQLQDLARNSVLAQLHKLRYPPFRFLDLPLELQMQILQHTNLVATCFVAWDSSERFRIISSGRPCSQHTDPDESRRDPHIEWEVFCAARHAAFNVRCECRDSPLNYFLVSKAFAVVARYVFYARNEFRLLPRRWYTPDRYASDADDDYYQLSLQSFLRRMPPDGMRNITKVVIIFPPITPTYLLPQQRGWEAWVQAVDSLAEADLPRLNLELHFTDISLSDHSDLISVEQVQFSHQFLRARLHRYMTLEAAMLGTYKRILGPLKKISRPRSLFVHVPWPLCKAGYEDRKANELELERLIMGDGYDSAAVGKPDESPYSQPMCLY